MHQYLVVLRTPHDRGRWEISIVLADRRSQVLEDVLRGVVQLPELIASAAGTREGRKQGGEIRGKDAVCVGRSSLSLPPAGRRLVVHLDVGRCVVRVMSPSLGRVAIAHVLLFVVEQFVQDAAEILQIVAPGLFLLVVGVAQDPSLRQIDQDGGAMPPRSLFDDDVGRGEAVVCDGSVVVVAYRLRDDHGEAKTRPHVARGSARAVALDPLLERDALDPLEAKGRTAVEGRGARDAPLGQASREEVGDAPLVFYTRLDRL